mmetsp:Transcript_82711/g.230655  ORF Transcript_82711/g.230655 Transcript_82711/m.230655 type:complete len:399 (+) Transcript_82711:2010-3206(+)
MEEARRRLQDLAAVAHRAPENAAEHVAAAVVRGHRPVGERDCERADMVRDDTVRHVHKVGVLGAHLAAVGASARLFLDLVENLREEVGVVVTPFVHEDGGYTLEAHARVHALGGQLSERAVRLAVKLHEDVVPDLQHVWIVHVDQVSGITATDTVVVNLSAWPAWAGIPHLPEVVLHVEGQDSAFGEVLLPNRPRFLVRRHLRLLGVAAVVCGVEPGWVNPPDHGEKLPRPCDGLLFEVVAERPIPKHFEKGVVIDVLAHIFKVVVFPTRADALLGVRRALQLGKRVRRVNLANKNGLELVHAGVDEEERWIVVRHHCRGRHEIVTTLFLEKLDEGCAHRRPVPLARGFLARRWARSGGRRWRRREFALLLAHQRLRAGHDGLETDIGEVLVGRHCFQ